jgi:hypothetical protein
MPTTLENLPIDCENCGHSSDSSALACADCGEQFGFIIKPLDKWKPNDYGAWIFARHFQTNQLVIANGYASLSRQQQLIHLVGYLYYEYMNGGLWQYFGNPGGVDAPLLHKALLEINAPKTADLIARVLQHFPQHQPQAEMDERDETLDSISEQDCVAFDKKADNLINQALPEILVQLAKHINQ